MRGRVGYAFDNMLPYLTGGAAFARVASGVPGVGSNRQWVAGWTAGGGVEVATSENLSFKLEALYVDLNDASWTGAVPVRVQIDKTYVIRASVNWRF